MPKITQNGSSLQIIIPKNVCQSLNLKAGSNVYVTTDGKTVQMSPAHTPLENEVNTVYTIGYESRTLDKFIGRLKNHGIQQIIDVREKPISRKKGFSKTPLMQRLDEEGINYVHIPKLGSPSEIRHEYKEGGSESAFFEKYEKYVHEKVPNEINVLEQHTSNMTSAIMCFELSHFHCHRKILADELKNMGYRVVHL